MARKIYMAVFEAEEPPLKGTNGEILTVVEFGLIELHRIRKEDPENNAAVNDVAIAILIALLHCLDNRDVKLGTNHDPEVVLH